MVRWACERPLTEWPLELSSETLPGTALLVDTETRLPHQLCLEWEVNAADPAAELFENERIREALAVCRAAKAPQAYTAFRALLTSRPVLTGAELALLGGDPDCGMLLHDVIKRCYELCRFLPAGRHVPAVRSLSLPDGAAAARRPPVRTGPVPLRRHL